VQNLNAIAETTYLSVENSLQYRRIMRIFYVEYEKMHFQLYKEEVLNLLHQDDSSYSIEQLKVDLESLVRWKNLTPIQDPGRVYTIADYKNKQYRYTMSEYAVEIERMTIRLENLFIESGNLSTNFFIRLEKSLDEAEEMNHKSLKEVNEWWNLIQEDFKRLNQNYQDYLRDFYSGKTERLMKSVEFIVYKDRFIQYLTEFIQELQLHSNQIERILNRQNSVIEEQLLEKVVQSELDIPHAVLEQDGLLEPNIRKNVQGKWISLKNWFVNTPEYECESRKVLKITNDIIRSIIQNAALIVQIQNWGISRKDDYHKFLKLFLGCSNMQEAHKVAAHVFGIQQVEHYSAIEQTDSDSVNQSAYEKEPMMYLLKPRVQTYREKKSRQGFKDKSEEKQIQKMAYLEKITAEKNIVLHYIKENRLDFSSIDEVVSEGTKNVFLQWIAQAESSSTLRGRTEYGQEYTMKVNEGTCVLHCEDGDLIMPAYVLEFDHE